MELSATGLDLIKRSEGLRLTQYRDVAGFPTIGYGHKVVPMDALPETISDAIAEMLLEQDVETASRSVEALVKVPLSQGQFDALVDFVFNLGAGRLAQSTLLGLLNRGNYVGAGQQLLRWDHAGDKELSALKTRRAAELALWESA